MLIPFEAVAHLDEAHAFFGEAAREQALAAEIVGRRLVDAIHFERRVGFAGEVGHFRNFALHAESEFVRFDHTFSCASALACLSCSRFKSCTRSSWRRWRSIGSRPF